MTSEVALMNRLGVALAADSATTVTYWQDGERKQRYFKGANKIFNLSSTHPIGLMTFAAGTLQGMPWEVVVKAYRASRGSAAKDTVTDYASDFFKYLANKSLFPVNEQELKLVRGVCETAGNIAVSIMMHDQVKNASDDVTRKTAAATLLADTATLITADPFITPECPKLVDETKRTVRQKIVNEFQAGKLYGIIKDVIDTVSLIEISMQAYFKERWTDLEKTGIVFAGYGDKDFFPRLEQHECFGVVLGVVLCRSLRNESRAITFETASEIVPIAQDEMVNTFMFGASLDALVRIGGNFSESLEEYTQELITAGALNSSFDANSLQKKAADAFRDKTRKYIWEQHALPLRRVVGMLPVDELAELAETLVSIESLKERVTRHTETVSGPIDVAVITKGDGFIWIKRKHYFDPNLNIRFVAKKHKETDA